MRRFSISFLYLASFLAAVALWPAAISLAPAGRPAGSSNELRALVARAIANQHHDDLALAEYERTERRLLHKSDEDAPVTEDKTYRVVPTGTGAVRVQTEENGRPVDAELYRKGLRDLEQALVSAVNPGEARQKRAIDKAAKRERDRAELVDAVLDAFTFSLLGTETRDGHTLTKLALEPNPAFKPTSRNTSLLANVRATVWIDQATGQLARAEAEIIRDVSFGGGLVGKVYRGGRFRLEQAEVAPGVWLPTRYEYNYQGRKFLFGFTVHEITEASHYRHIGPPRDALVVIRRELSGPGAPSSASPR